MITTRSIPSAVTMTSLCSMVLVRMMCHRKTLLNCINLGGNLMKILDSIHLDMGVINSEDNFDYINIRKPFNWTSRIFKSS